MFAVVATGGKQYRVSKGSVISVEKLPDAEKSAVRLEQVLMLGDGADTLSIGTPFVEGACVCAHILKQARAPKITIFKKKRRQNYRRTKGHRQALTWLKVDAIETKGA